MIKPFISFLGIRGFVSCYLLRGFGASAGRWEPFLEKEALGGEQTKKPKPESHLTSSFLAKGSGRDCFPT